MEVFVSHEKFSAIPVNSICGPATASDKPLCLLIEFWKMPANGSVLRYLLSIAMVSSVPVTLSIFKNVPIDRRGAILSMLMTFLASVGAKRITNGPVMHDSMTGADSKASLVSSVMTVPSANDECKLRFLSCKHVC